MTKRERDTLIRLLNKCHGNLVAFDTESKEMRDIAPEGWVAANVNGDCIQINVGK